MANTQKRMVLSDLKRFKRGITSMKAFEKYGITRLAAVVHDLREDGHDIKTEMIAVKNRYGETCHVANYTLESK